MFICKFYVYVKQNLYEYFCVIVDFAIIKLFYNKKIFKLWNGE